MDISWSKWSISWTHRIHATGIFTYMNVGFYGKCRYNIHGSYGINVLLADSNPGSCPQELSLGSSQRFTKSQERDWCTVKWSSRDWLHLATESWLATAGKPMVNLDTSSTLFFFSNWIGMIGFGGNLGRVGGLINDSLLIPWIRLINNKTASQVPLDFLLIPVDSLLICCFLFSKDPSGWLPKFVAVRPASSRNGEWSSVTRTVAGGKYRLEVVLGLVDLPETKQSKHLEMDGWKD